MPNTAGKTEQTSRSPKDFDGLTPESFVENDVYSWTVEDVGRWLELIGYPEYTLSFSVHKIDGVALMLLTEYDLKQELGIKVLGDVKRIFSIISLLHEKNRLLDTTVPVYVEEEKCKEKWLNLSNFKHRNYLTPSNTNVPKRSRTYSSDSQTESCNGETAERKSTFIAQSNKWASGVSRNLPPEYFKTAVSCLYMFLVTWLTAIIMVFVHDRVPDKKRHPPLPDIFLDNVPHIAWAFQLCEITILILSITWLSILFFHKHRSVLMRRFSALSGSVFLLRCATMFITSLSVPGHHLDCAPREESDLWTKIEMASVIWRGGGLSIKGVRTCGDYMFSGHTTALTLLNFFITEYTPRRMYFLHIASWVLNTFGIFFILAAHEHYSIDVFIAFYITSRMFLYYHSLANNRALHQRDSFRTKIWFPMFSYFEAQIDGIVPNEYTNPLSKDNIKWFLCHVVTMVTKLRMLLADLTHFPSPVHNNHKKNF